MKPLQFGPRPPCGWRNVSDCGQIGFHGMIVGGKEAAPMEFPHMAGKHNDATGKRFVTFLEPQPLDGETTMVTQVFTAADL